MKHILWFVVAAFFSGGESNASHGERTVLESGRTQLLVVPEPYSTGYLEFEAKSTHTRSMRHAGQLRIIGEDCELLSIVYNPGASSAWRNYLLEIPPGTRVLQIQNLTGVKIKLRNFRWGDRYYGGLGSSGSVRNSASIGDGLFAVVENARAMRPYVANADSATLFEVSNKARICLSFLETQGELSQEIRECTRELIFDLQEIDRNLLENLTEIPELAYSAGEIRWAMEIIENVID